AAKYHVSISQLRNLNGIKGNNIRAGRSLRIR
ncbi:LysM peptidoglycan-binding domain-containing protein, partial [Phocaeicola vulgatus]|nr:LysM peptidoglycan-binding domain-containing protein [Phocaeicola vulgatus]